MATSQQQKKEEAPVTQIPAEEEDAVIDKKSIHANKDKHVKKDDGSNGSELLDENNNEPVKKKSAKD